MTHWKINPFNHQNVQYATEHQLMILTFRNLYPDELIHDPEFLTFFLLDPTMQGNLSTSG
jgi:hypothetical protein